MFSEKWSSYLFVLRGLWIIYIVLICPRFIIGVKCDHYWPFTDEPVMYGEISSCIYVLNIRLPLQADESQDILHLNYTSWPDHGVPTVNAIESILQFVHIVRQQANRTKDPIIVHCRSGYQRYTAKHSKHRLLTC
uniref:Tyrosine-protein phosphatase domain-containing protein n=1 Tax=Labrus bergylta TaxID=56723 RepID=A0A3Q3FLB4_9LABR